MFWYQVGLSGQPLPPSLLQDVFVELGSHCSHTELAGLPGLLLAARPPNRFFMCLGFPHTSRSFCVEQPVSASQTTQGISEQLHQVLKIMKKTATESTQLLNKLLKYDVLESCSCLETHSGIFLSLQQLQSSASVRLSKGHCSEAHKVFITLLSPFIWRLSLIWNTQD